MSAQPCESTKNLLNCTLEIDELYDMLIIVVKHTYNNKSKRMQYRKESVN